ncbi:MAG TPA: glycosyltransferase, partial [Solirubrobacteraceae bacterium]|nr:glycosyltransferase [Solirubrobacteraceae bacterium]
MPIPRVFHRIWLGDAELPEEYRRYGESWARHHPEWEMRLWTEREIAELESARPEAKDTRRHPAERSDLLRYEILHRFGGVYIDTDMECLKPIDPLLEGVGFFAGKVRGDRLNNAIIGCEAGHPSAKNLSRKAKPVALDGNATKRVDQYGTGPYFLSSLLHKEQLKRRNITLFDPSVFYPKPKGPYGDAYAVHHQGRSWYRTPEERRVAALEEQLADTELELETVRLRLARTQRQLAAAERTLARRRPW